MVLVARRFGIRRAPMLPLAAVIRTFCILNGDLQDQIRICRILGYLDYKVSAWLRLRCFRANSEIPRKHKTETNRWLSLTVGQ
jgi:hypothetical protein